MLWSNFVTQTDNPNWAATLYTPFFSIFKAPLLKLSFSYTFSSLPLISSKMGRGIHLGSSSQPTQNFIRSNFYDANRSKLVLLLKFNNIQNRNQEDSVKENSLLLSYLRSHIYQTEQTNAAKFKVQSST